MANSMMYLSAERLCLFCINESLTKFLRLGCNKISSFVLIRWCMLGCINMSPSVFILLPISTFSSENNEKKYLSYTFFIKNIKMLIHAGTVIQNFSLYSNTSYNKSYSSPQTFYVIH